MEGGVPRSRPLPSSRIGGQTCGPHGPFSSYSDGPLAFAKRLERLVSPAFCCPHREKAVVEEAEQHSLDTLWPPGSCLPSGTPSDHPRPSPTLQGSGRVSCVEVGDRSQISSSRGPRHAHNCPVTGLGSRLCCPSLSPRLALL